ncbi:isochorismate synthase [Austwickia chelonae]|uniref:isochorismate synthase n=1 Tax=Austwickia chelonae TaxID=100225 RepID=UPI0013C2AE81|nr:isochorismate synthase [Austwickia chelonae]
MIPRALFTVPTPPRPVRLRFHTTQGSLKATGGRIHTMDVSSPGELASWAREQGTVAGAISFDGRTAALSVVYEMQRHGDLLLEEGSGWNGFPRVVGNPEETPTPADYRSRVEKALSVFEQGALDKIVLARKLRLRFETTVPAEYLYQALVEAHPEARTYAVSPAEGQWLVGASPELLVSRQGRTVTSHPLAGSVPRSPDPVEDENRGRRLLTSEKDLREHSYVVEMIADTLSPYCRRLAVADRPALVGTRTVWHLGTWIEGELRDQGTTALELAAALQPTPALAGAPVASAVRTLEELEPFARDYYGGCIGWCDDNGDGEWTVAIRCASVRGPVVDLYAGAGIVAGSDPEAELAETTAKLSTLADVLLASELEVEAAPDARTA